MVATTRVLTLCLSLIVGLGIVACGGSSSSSSPALALISATPPDGEVDVASGASFVLEFNQALRASSVTAESVQLAVSNVQVPAQMDVEGGRITITPASALPLGAEVQVFVHQDLRSQSGQPLSAGQTLRYFVDQGRFRHPAELVWSEFGSDAAAIGDLNGDGVPDVVLAHCSPVPSSTIGVVLTLFPGRPGGDLGAGTVLATAPQCSAPSILMHDVDGDGRTDVLLGLAGQGIRVFRQGGDGSFVQTQSIGLAGPNQLRLGDLDADGLLELASAGEQSIRIWRFSSQGTLAMGDSIAVSGYWINGFEVGDISDDGLADVVVTYTYGGPFGHVEIFRQAPGGGFAPSEFRTADPLHGASGIAMGDLNGDGRLDVVVTSGSNRPTSIGVYYQNAQGELGTMTPVETYDVPLAVRVADIDGDGRDDVVVAHGGWLATGVYLQQANGTLAPEALYRSPYGSYGVSTLAVGDVNGDGKRDIVVGGSVLFQKDFITP